jgi:hypothetical protein
MGRRNRREFLNGSGACSPDYKNVKPKMKTTKGMLKMWYVRRLSDGKEFLAYSITINRETGYSGIFGVAYDGEKAELPDGTFDLYKR